MQTVPREIVLETWNEISDLDKKAARQLTRELFQHQPAIGIYCAAQDENLAEKGTVSPMIDLTMLTWKSLTRVAGRKLPIAAPEAIEAAEDAVTKQLEKLGEGSEMDMQDAALKLFESHNQREIMRFGIEVLMSRYAETPDLAPESLGLEMIWLNTVVECLDNLDFNALRDPIWNWTCQIGLSLIYLMMMTCWSRSSKSQRRLFCRPRPAATIPAPAAAAKNSKSAAEEPA